jgi:plastocyanin
MTVLEYEGQQPTGPLKAMWDVVPISKEGAVPTDAGQDGNHGSHGAEAPTPAPVEPTAAPATIPDTTNAGNEAVVMMLDDRFEARDLTIAAGTTVTWVNKGADWHSVAATDGGFQSEKIAPGDSYSVTFDTPGTYGYICKHHARQGMFGKIVVT